MFRARSDRFGLPAVFPRFLIGANDGQESLQHHRVKLLARLITQIVECSFKLPGVFVQALMNERIEHVDNSDNSRRQGDFVALQPARIPIAVIPFVVSASNLCP